MKNHLKKWTVDSKKEKNYAENCKFHQCTKCTVFLLSQTAVRNHRNQCLQTKGKKTCHPQDTVEVITLPFLSISLERISSHKYPINANRKPRRDNCPSKSRHASIDNLKVISNSDKIKKRLNGKRRGRKGGLEELMNNLGVKNLDAVVNTSSTPRQSRLAAKEKLRTICQDLNDPTTNGELTPMHEKIVARKRKRHIKNDDKEDSGNEQVFMKDSDDEESSSEYDDSVINRKESSGNFLVDTLYIHNCTKCTAKFLNAQQLIDHNKVHESTKEIFTCPVCDKAFRKRSYYHVHINRHVHSEAVEKTLNLWDKWPTLKGGNSNSFKHQFSCKFCLIRHPNQKSFLSHMEEQHPGRTKDSNNFSCPYSCDVTTDSILALVKHIKNNHKDKYFRVTNNSNVNIWKDPNKAGKYWAKCDICQENVNAYYLKYHKESHEKAKAKLANSRFYCGICFIGVKDRYKLQRHFVIHLQNNPFVCTFPNCGLKFQDFPYLNKHLKRHVSQILTCPKCDITYKESPGREHKCVFDENRIRLGSDGKKYLKGTRVDLSKSITTTSPHLVESISTSKVDDKKSKETQNASIVKMEMSDNIRRFELESVHYIDKIIETDDGAIHVKGEQLNPMEEASFSNDTVDFTSVEDMKGGAPSTDNGNALAEYKGDRLKLIIEDPVYQQLIKEKPEYAELMEGRRSRKDFSSRCDDCGAYFKRFALLETHRRKCQDESITDRKPEGRSKTDVQPNEISATSICTYCGYSSSSQTDLQHHLKTAPNHGNASKYQYRCPFERCGIPMKTSTALDKHVLLVHSTEKKFKCDYVDCGKSFFSDYRLKCHARNTHGISAQTGKTSKQGGKKVVFKCKRCNLQFSDGISFAKHKRQHHYKIQVSLPNRCQICGDECATRHSLKRHIMLVHTKSHIRQEEIVTQSGSQEDADANGYESDRRNGESTSNVPTVILGF